MSQARQIIQAYRVITNDLWIKNVDGSVPRANMAIFTDGNGGTYKTDLCGNIPSPGMNMIQITNTGSTIVADLSYNKLSLTYGRGIRIAKGVSNTLLFEADNTSSITSINTPSGQIYTGSPQGQINIMPDYGINLTNSTNTLIIGAYPNFNTITVGNSNITATPNLSTLVLQQGDGIILSTISENTILIDANRANTLNRITLSNFSTFNFSNIFNNLNYTTSGPLSLVQTNESTLRFRCNAFSLIDVAGRKISNTSTINIVPQYGISTSIVNNSLYIGTNLPQPITTISTSSGIVNNYSTINFIEGVGIKYSTNLNNLTVQLDKPYFSYISATGTSDISANSTNRMSFTAGSSIVYTNKGSSLEIDTRDFNRINVANQSTIYSSHANKTLNLSTIGDVSILTDPSSNTLIFQVTPYNVYPYSQVSVFNSKSMSVSTSIAAKQIDQGSMNLVATAPFTISTVKSAQNFLYLGIDSVSLLSSTTSSISALSTSVNNGNFGSIGISGVPVITNVGTVSRPIINVSSNSIQTTNLTAGNIVGPTASTFIKFDYVSSFMYTYGTVVSENFATFSDSSLKKFKKHYTITDEQLSNLTPWYFDWLADGKPDIGFAAEDVEKIAPEIVKHTREGLKMVDYSRLSVLAISALRDTVNRVTKLEKDMEKLMKYYNDTQQQTKQS